MPIRRKHDNDPDWMAKRQDKELIYLEQRISALYEEASHQITEEYNRFYSNYQLEYERRLAMVESGEMSQDSFNTWCRNQIFQSNRYQAMISSLTDVLVNADVAAMAAVNEQLPFTLAESYDFISSLGFEAADKAGITMGTFQIYNADSVREIIRQNPNLFPVVDLPEDEAWNRRHINNEIMQAIIQGDSMQQVARRLQSVAAMDDRAAIRNARTAMTAAENLGRSESARRLKEKGLPVKEVWSATKDSRTRNTHLLLDGTEKDDKGYYGADILAIPLRFPADPNGEPQEIYNCRCRENVQIAGIDHSRDDELYENFMRENYPEDWQALQQREAESGKADERREALERQRRLREERQTQKREELPSVDELLPVENLSSGSIGYVAGSDLRETWARREEQFDFEIDDIIDAQGFNGLPQVVDADEFDLAVQRSGFIAQRTYGAGSLEEVQAYREQLYHGDFYVNCGVGGAQYGQGMYCAADYNWQLTDGIRSEMAHYQELAAERFGGARSEADQMRDAMVLVSQRFGNVEGSEEYMRALRFGGFSDSAVAIMDDFEGRYGEDYAYGLNSIWSEIPEFQEAHTLTETLTLKPDARIINYRDLRREWLQDPDSDSEDFPTDIGAYAALRGYDAINAEGHGESGSYTVILNRTACIFRREET